MIAIALYWLIGVYVFLNLGKLLEKTLRIKENYLFFSIINGLFIFLVYFSIVSIFSGVYNFLAHFFLVILILYSVWTNMEFSFLTISKWLVSKKKMYVFLALLFFVFLLLSAQIPYFHVNDTYYIQTIKWAGQYGLTKGLINLHPFLGQFSTWHILQAGFNPGFMIFNDINGLVLLIYFLYLLCRVGKMRENKIYTFSDRLLLFYFISFPLLLIFINSPSPDLPVIIFSQMAFYLFIKNYYTLDREEFIQLLIFVLFAAIIKSTAIPLVFLPLIILVRHRKIVKSLDFFYYLLSIVFVFGFLLYKNYIISGYPFFPFSFFSNHIHVDWKYPIQILHKYIDTSKQTQYGGEISSSAFVNFYNWLFQPNFFLFIMNYLWFLSFLVFPFFIYKHSHKRALWWIYIIAIIYFFILISNAPFLAYFIYFEILFLIVILDKLFTFKINNKLLKGVIASVFIISVGLFYTHYKNWDMIYNPSHISKYDTYENIMLNDFILNYPDGKNLFWETGDALLPAAQPKMLDSLIHTQNKKYNLILRGRGLEQGFRLQEK